MSPYRFEQSLQTVLGDLAESRKFRGRIGQWMLGEEWRKAVGPWLAEHARPVSLEKDVLKLAVESSVWANELEFQKEEIIRRLKGATGWRKVKSVRFLILPAELKLEEPEGLSVLPDLDDMERARVRDVAEGIEDEGLRKLVKAAFARALQVQKARRRT